MPRPSDHTAPRAQRRNAQAAAPREQATPPPHARAFTQSRSDVSVVVACARQRRRRLLLELLLKGGVLVHGGLLREGLVCWGEGLVCWHGEKGGRGGRWQWRGGAFVI